MTTYTCAQCSAPASVENGAVVRTCLCDAPIHAHIRATASGQGTASNSSGFSRLFELLISVVRRK